METELNLDPDPNPEPDPELITETDPKLQIIPDLAGSGSTTVAVGHPAIPGLSDSLPRPDSLLRLHGIFFASFITGC